MQIVLDTEKQPLYFVTDRPDLSMTLADPGPKDVAWEKLNNQQKVDIKKGIIQRVLQRIDSDDAYGVDDLTIVSQTTAEEVTLPQETGGVVQSEQTFRSKNRRKQMEEHRKQTERKQYADDAKRLLRKRVGTIKSFLADFSQKDVPLVRVALELEKEKKRTRPSVVEVLENFLESTPSDHRNVTSVQDDPNDVKKVEINPDGTAKEL